MNPSLWQLAVYSRHRHDALLAERRTCASLALLPCRSTLATFRRTLGLYLIAAGRSIAGADALNDSRRPLHPAV